MALEAPTRSQWPGSAAGVATLVPSVSKPPASVEASAAGGAAGPALETGGNLATIAGKDFATQTTLAAVLAKIIAAPATSAKQDDILTALNSIASKLDTANGHLANIKTNTDRIP